MATNDVVIQLASYNSTNKVDNAEWTNNINEQITINQGDQIVVSKAYLDTRLNSSGNIIIPVDIPLSLEMYYYWINDGNSGNSKEFFNQVDGNVDLNWWQESGIAPEYTVIYKPNDDPIIKFADWHQPQITPDPTGRLYADGRPYILTWTDNQTPYTQTWRYTLPAGSYTPDELANILTREMAVVKKDSVLSLKQGKPSQWLQETFIPETGTTSNIGFWDEPFIVNTRNDHLQHVEGLKNPQSGIYDFTSYYNKMIIVPNDTVNYPFVAGNTITPNLKSLAFKSLISDYPIPDANQNLPANINDPNNFYIYPLKKLFNIILNKPAGGSSQIFRSYQSYNFPTVGSTEISLTYDDQASLFKWQYTHTPILQATTSAKTAFNEVVGLVNTNSTLPTSNTSSNVNVMCKVQCQSGVMFRDMQPRSFWMDILGFDPSIMVKDEEVLGPITSTDKFPYSRFNAITTRGFLGCAQNFDETSSAITQPFPDGVQNAPLNLLYNPKVDDWSTYELYLQIPDNGFIPPKYNSIWFQSESTITIDAVRAPLNNIVDSSGHQLVEIVGYQNDWLNEIDKYQIKCIVSSYYVSENSFTTNPFPDTYVYTHIGAPMSINNYKVRILDPLTLDKLSTLGPNSTIYLQIVKQLTLPEQEQVEI